MINKISMIVALLLIVSCSIYSPAERSLITYRGFDFSVNALNGDESQQDVYLRDRNPYITGSAPDGYLYFQTTADSSYCAKDFGYEPYNTFDRVPADIVWDTVSTPVFPGHLYIIKCGDGFAKCRVLSYSGENIYLVQVDVLYEFASDSDSVF